MDSKKSYVRYISHELRTPLNTAFLGLKLLTGEMRDSKDPKDAERYDTLCDVNFSCSAAVDILNDLLCYEKLDSGILELHKENVMIIPFLNDCISMFSIQAKECGVTLTVLTDCNNDKKQGYFDMNLDNSDINDNNNNNNSNNNNNNNNSNNNNNNSNQKPRSNNNSSNNNNNSINNYENYSLPSINYSNDVSLHKNEKKNITKREIDQNHESGITDVYCSHNNNNDIDDENDDNIDNNDNDNNNNDNDKDSCNIHDNESRTISNKSKSYKFIENVTLDKINYENINNNENNNYNNNNDFDNSSKKSFKSGSQKIKNKKDVENKQNLEKIDSANSYALQPHDQLYADKFKMDQVIRNLLSNALKFTPRGGTVTIKATFVHEPLLINSKEDLLRRKSSFDYKNYKLFSYLNSTLRKKRDRLRKLRNLSEVDTNPNSIRLDPNSPSFQKNALQGKLVVVVTDTGAGISTDNQKRLFKDIVQFSPEKLQAGGGSGLGLWITGGKHNC